MWRVYEEDEAGDFVVYSYETRAKARAHVARVRNNPFLAGLRAHAYNARTGEPA